MGNQLNALILNHTNATLEIRELIAFNDAESTQLLQNLCDDQFENVLIVSTCNRTEIYFDAGNENTKKVLIHVQSIKKVDDSIINQFILLNDAQQVVIYLARVSMGLESLILGDLQIFNQIKRAYQQSIDNKLASPNLHRLMHTIFYAHKRVVKETSFRMGVNSVSYAVADMVRKKVNEFVSPKVLVVGTGEIGKNLVKNLVQLTDKNLISITNRTDEKAQCLAARTKTSYLPYKKLTNKINSFDIIVFAIQVNTPLIFSEDIETKKFRPKYLFDLGVPRIIDPKIESIPSVILYNVDEVQVQIKEAQSKRSSSVKEVEAIILESCKDYFTWTEKLVATSSIKFLKEELEKICNNEINKNYRTGWLSKQEVGKLNLISQDIIRKIINFHMLQFNMACKRGEAETIIEVINELFNVEKSKK